jgi:hypothetical protein
MWMFVPHRKHTSPRPVTEIASLYFYFMGKALSHTLEVCEFEGKGEGIRQFMCSNTKEATDCSRPP